SPEKDAKGSADEAWIWDKLEISGGGIKRAELREMWKEETDKSGGQFRTVLGRMKEKAYIVEHDGMILDAMCAGNPDTGGENA
ncbi:hypothetical protein LCF14_005056, partial [Salmonella enterica]|nr:hypothetical protein [Salmonella enterica]